MAGCSRGGAEQAQYGARPAVPVLVAKAVRKTVPEELHAIGSVEAHSSVQIKAQVGGIVTKVLFHQGQDVKKGQILFTIDPRPFQAALLKTQADLAKDQAQMAQAKADYNRYAYLLKTHVGSRQQYDQALATYKALQASVAADKAAIDTAKLNLSYTQIRSPIDGRTGSLMMYAGNLVKANADTAMVVVNQVRPVYVDFSVPEQHLDQIRGHMAEHPLSVYVNVPGQQEKERGDLTFIDNEVNNTTGTILLKGTFPNADEKLWPGQFVTVTLVLKTLPDQVLVPSQAVQTGQQGSYVFVVGPKSKAEMRKVAVGATINGQTVIEHGIKPGETVVTDGQLRLVPGATVTIRKGLEAQAVS